MLSALADEEPETAFDRHVALYDRLVGNRLLWGTSPYAFAAFAAAAVQDGEGPLLDVACGSAVLTAATYQATTRELVLVDRSWGCSGEPRSV